MDSPFEGHGLNRSNRRLGPMRGSQLAGDQSKLRGAAAKEDSTSRDAEPQTPAKQSAAQESTTPSKAGWGGLWQAPAILISAVLIGMGVFRAAGPPHENDFDGALNQVRWLIESSRFAEAAERLNKGIEPFLEKATEIDRARFHATVADLVSISQAAQDLDDPAANRQIAEQFDSAVKLGLTLSAAQLERWADAAMAIGETASARKRLMELDALDAAAVPVEEGDQDETSVNLRATRNRVFRHLVERGLRQPDLSFQELMDMLSEYRQNRRLSAADELWAVARQTELRLEANRPQEAVDALLVDMRRLEGEAGNANLNFGELYVQLGRAYAELGDEDRAQEHLRHALELCPGSDPNRGDALVLLGQLALSRGDFDAAYEHFHIVVRDFLGTPSYLRGMLGRAEVQAILGDHQASQADYRALAELLPKSGMRRDVTPQRVASSLCDRHDAALALGRLDRALQYASIAEELFPSDHVPIEVLIRLASTNRQMADDLVASSGDGESVNPLIRSQANTMYERAGEYYMRHSSAETSTPLSEGDWASSLWMAADSFDRAGRQDRAVQQFISYLDSRSIDDPRRPETLFRLAQALQAQTEYEKAITYYEKIANEHSRSTFATQSYVPLARCYLAVGRRPEAQQQLKLVLAGDRLLKPDASDYREALIELGRIYHESGDFTSAIEQFAEAAQRYPDDPKRLEILYLLADSYRGGALALADRARNEPALSLAEIGRLNVLRTEHLQRAEDLFASICDEFASAPATTDEHADDLLRRSQLYRADCAFYLEHFEQAIDLYDHAAREYSSHSSSMYALIQIVNCYSAMGDAERSAAAHHRALVRLKQLPDNAFAAPDSLMDRAAWERWLQNTPVGPPVSATASASNE